MFAFNLAFSVLVLAGIGIHLYWIIRRVRAGEMDPLFGVVFGFFGALTLPLIPLMWSI